MKYHKLVFQPGDIKIEVEKGSTIVQAMIAAGRGHDFPCGGRGKCGKCRVRILEGTKQPTSRELALLEPNELDEGIRLACMTQVHDEMSIELLHDKKLQHNILMTSVERPFELEPHIIKTYIEVAKPSLDDNRSDLERLRWSLAKNLHTQRDLETAVSLLRRLPDTLREAEHHVTAVIHNNELLGLEKQDTTGSLLGMAFDIGTTTIVGYLLELYSGEELAVVSMLNPQTKFGADVISRINFANQAEGGLTQLHGTVIEAVNNLIADASRKAGINSQHIYAASIAANTTMHHLFLGTSPRSIAIAPYVSVVSEGIAFNASELKIDINRAGKIFMLPNVAGFVGCDTTAVLLATELDTSEDIKLVVDIGTNGEIALGSREKIVACSAAAGPAFEGAQISSGMRGTAGAIDHVYFGEQLEFSVIGGGVPRGICGSALLDAVAGLVELGIIDKRGKILSADKLANPTAKRFEDHIVEHNGQLAFLLVTADKTGHGRHIMVTQGDIRELQLAKGAMAAGVTVLMEKLDVHVEDIKEVLLAGAFGNYLNSHSACVIGLIPQELEGKIKMIGNAAGTGAKLALLSSGEYQRVGDIAGAVEFVELGSHPRFNSIFGKCTYFTIPDLKAEEKSVLASNKFS